MEAKDKQVEVNEEALPPPELFAGAVRVAAE